MTKFIPAKDLPFNLWFDFIKVRSPLMTPNNYFPSSDIKNEFLEKIQSWTESEIRAVLRCFLINNGYFSYDEDLSRYLYSFSKEGQEELINSRELYFRISEDIKNAREGLTWVLDFLPNYPAKALSAIGLYFESQSMSLPDSAIRGISDATSIVTARYINVSHSSDHLTNLSPEGFEIIIAKLYSLMGYETQATKRTHDGGIDIFAEIIEKGVKTKNLIQCKKYKKPISVKEIRELLGVVHSERANKGILVTTSSFTAEAKDFEKYNPQIELIDYSALLTLLNKNLGKNWPDHLQHYIYGIPLSESIT
ncbi:restriction endonuclease [Leptospira neocaledonica]|uniref:Restriction endonuclease type IV Mrr domain-containing protein n=1 Tax=Leptospira neocaledonica TaxID=2023192 RepID=A0A2M9ZZG3_9LEPT|nr:restriction endonuclease [Leptospira neocaledonica]PJZ77437.1 hypothetical protein CH365_07585 [Leptospira neocaledonica]